MGQVEQNTGEADVGAGTFYNYFSPISGFLAVVVHESTDYVSNALDCSVSQMADPADVWSGSLRYLARYAVTQQVWGWFLLISVRPILHLCRPWVLDSALSPARTGQKTVPYR